jgi:flagellar basal-body rod modification protein FlgD
MVTSVQQATLDSASGAAAMKKATGMNKDDFLKLFVTQMQNQDPLNPMDSTQFIGQLAQLTQVEQAYNTNTNLQSLLTAQSSNATLGAVSFLGTQVTAKGSQISLVDGQQSPVAFALPSQADSVVIEIRNAQGTVVRTINRGQSPQGTTSLAWDGLNSSGQRLPAGIYTLGVTATAAGQQFLGTPLVQGKVDGISLEGTEPLLSVGGSAIPLSSVISVKGV